MYLFLERLMMTKKAKDDKNAIMLKATSEADKTKQLDELSVSASMLNATLAKPFIDSIVSDITLVNIVNGIKQQIAEVKAGDMTSIEAMLVAQANSLQTIFVSLGRKAINQTGLPQYTAMFNLALKAQAQSRATTQALTELKYPKQTNFVKQANIANGHQQINNATSTHAPAHTGEIINQPNELLSESNNATMDSSRAATTSGTDKAMATLDKIDRS